MTELGLADKVLRLDRGLSRAGIPHAFGGALALAYYAVPRATVDIDVNVFVPTTDYARVTPVLRRVGVTKIPEESLVTRDGQVRAWWENTPVDLFFSYDEIHEAMRSATRTVPFGKEEIPILAPEHLLVAKAAFNRAKDWIDIEQVLIAQADLDVGETERRLARLVGASDPREKRFRKLAGEARGET